MMFDRSPSSLGVRPAAALSTAFLSQAFFWMFVGLLVTTGVGLLLSGLSDEQFARLAGLWLPIVLVQLGLAVTLSLAIRRLSATAALGLFFVYAASMGVTLGIVLRVYAPGTVLAAGLSAASIFGAASIYGAVTGRDLTRLGAYLFMALVGVLVALVVNLFLGSSLVGFIVSVIGVVVFTGLTAYDVQRIGRGELAAWTESMEKGAVMGAFVLYLDFVNLFLMLLRLFGTSRD
ncbi:MAG: hypothetical protein C4343_06620 [Chloroflexota bacterium]